MGMGIRLVRTAGAGVCALALLVACGQDEPLPGERLDIRAGLDLPAPPEPAGPVAFTAPAPQQLASWTHRAGNAQHRVSNPALRTAPALAWSARIGQGENRRYRITADPVVAGGRVFTLDSRALVTATSTSGETLWQRDLTPESERDGEGSGGGLATDGARVYVTSGFGSLTALDAATGAEVWAQRLGAPATSAPTIDDGTVYAVSVDSRGWALDAATGRIKWEVVGAPSPSGVLGGGSPAVTDQLVLMPFHSGELVGVLKLSGLRIWNAFVTGSRQGRVYAQIVDVTGDPVVAGDVIYAGNPGGRSVALDLASGERIWTAEDGASSPVFVSGGSVFLLSDQNELVRLDARTGARIWAVELPYFTRERVRRRDAIFDHYGPVLAGGRLFVASSDNQLRTFDPATGTPMGSVPLPGGAASLPAVVNGTLYVVSGDGRLHAFR